jgi:hypothetical protein
MVNVISFHHTATFSWGGGGIYKLFAGIWGNINLSAAKVLSLTLISLVCKVGTYYTKPEYI